MGGQMDIDSMPPFDPVPTPNEEFCIFREPRSEPHYLKRYGVILFNPDPELKREDVKFFVWSVFDLEDLGFKVFLDGSYNYKINAGVEQGVKRFESSEYAPGIISCPRTKENLWFISYRLNQLPSEHVFYPARPPGLSNIPPQDMLSPGDVLDIIDAQRKEKEVRMAKQPDQNTPAPLMPQLFCSPNNDLAMHSELEKKLNEVTEALKKWVDVPSDPKPTFNELLTILVAPDPIKRLTMVAHGVAAVIQKRDSMQYFRDIVTVPFWQHKKNNVATKITRAHFGLPVEPITAININNAGKDTNDPQMTVERDIAEIQKQLSYGHPLAWLDEYTESTRGQPGMIRAKPKAENLEYKKLPRDLDDLLYEYEAAQFVARHPQQICRTDAGDQIIPELDLDDSFNFLEKYCMDDTVSVEPLRGGYPPSDDSSGDEEHGMEIDALDSELNEGADENADEEIGNMAASLRGGGPPNEHGESTPKRHRRGRGLGKVIKLGKRNEIWDKCEVYIDAEDRSDAAIEKLCFINAWPACLDQFKSPPKPNGELNVDKLRPHLHRLIESGQLKDALDILEPGPQSAEHEESLKARIACEPELPINCRSASAIKKLFELQGKLELLVEYLDGEGKLHVDKLRWMLPDWVRTGDILDVDGVFEIAYPHRKRDLVVAQPKKTLKEWLKPKRARQYDEFFIEREYQVSLPVEFRSPEARSKLFGLVLNTRPELVEKYRYPSGKLNPLLLFEDDFEVLTDMDADELIKAGGDPKKAVKETEEWTKYLMYQMDVLDQKELREDYLRGGAGSDSDDQGEMEQDDEDVEGDEEQKEAEEDGDEEEDGDKDQEGVERVGEEHEEDEQKEEEKESKKEVHPAIDTSDIDGYPHEWWKKFYELNIPVIQDRLGPACVRLYALPMQVEPIINERYRVSDGSPNRQLIAKEEKRVYDILHARDVRDLVKAGARIPARTQVAWWLAWMKTAGNIEPEYVRELEPDPPNLYGYPFKFLEDTYEIGKGPDKRSDSTIQHLFTLGKYLQKDETMMENYGDAEGKVIIENVKGVLSMWMEKVPQDFCDVVALLSRGHKPDADLLETWEREQPELPEPPKPQSENGHPDSDHLSSPNSNMSDHFIYSMDDTTWGELKRLYDTTKEPIAKQNQEALTRLCGLAMSAGPTLLAGYRNKEGNELNYEALHKDWITVCVRLIEKDVEDLCKIGGKIPADAETAELKRFFDWRSKKEFPASPEKVQHITPLKASGQAEPFEIGGVPFSPKQVNALKPTLKKYADLREEKQARSQVHRADPPRNTPPSGQRPRQPHFVIPHEEEVDEVDDEEMALARIELNAPENESPEARSTRIKRYREERKRAERRMTAKKAFVQNQSVQPTEDDMPTVPVFGRTVEEPIDFQGAPPTIYLNNYSQKRMREIEDENRQMENVLLDRAEYCGMCDAYITFESRIQKDNHYRGHRSVATSCGFCGISFAKMQDFEKQTHLKKHANTKYGAQNQLMPYRNIVKKSDYPHDDVFTFCEACGVDLHTFSTPQQIMSHTTNCRNEGNSASRQHDSADGDFYCHKCGENLSFKTKPERKHHVDRCRFRHALGPDGKDYFLSAFASQNVPGGGFSATEVDISRTYCHLLTLVDTRGPDDAAAMNSYKPRCKFHGCNVNLGEIAKRDKLMEHLGVHIGRRALRRQPCPYKGCDADFTGYRKQLQAKADRDGTVYSDAHLGDRIVKHMKEEHNASYGPATIPCVACLSREVQNGELSDAVQVTGTGTGAETKRLQDERNKLDAGRKELDDDRTKLEAEREQFEEDKWKEKERREVEKADKPTRKGQPERHTTPKETAPKIRKPASKEPKKTAPKITKPALRKPKKGRGEGATLGSDDEADKTDDEESPADKSDSVYGPPDKESSSLEDDSDPPDRGDPGYRRGPIDPKDADAELDDRPGVYERVPEPFQTAVKDFIKPKFKKDGLPDNARLKTRNDIAWVFACRGCGKKILAKELMNHRTVTSTGTKGCGLDDDQELVISTERHMNWYVGQMRAKKREKDPYLDLPRDILPKDPLKPFLWFVWRDLLDADLDATKHSDFTGLEEFRKYLLDNSEDIKAIPKVMELPLLNGKKEKWNKSPYQKSKGRKGTSAAAGAKTTKADARASTSAAARKPAKKGGKRKRRATDGEEDEADDAAQENGSKPRKSKKPKNKRSTI